MFSRTANAGCQAPLSDLQGSLLWFAAFNRVNSATKPLMDTVHASWPPLLYRPMPLFNAEISAGSLLPLESRRIAKLLLSKPDAATWQHAIEVENILQKKTTATARRQATLLRKRLTTLDAQAWQMITERESEVVNQLLLAAAVKHSQLLGDFMRKTYANCQRRLDPALSVSDWHHFLVDCAHQDPAVAGWSDATKAKLFEVIVRILTEAKYLQSTRSKTMTPQSLHPDVRRYLATNHETYVIDCLERTS